MPGFAPASGSHTHSCCTLAQFYCKFIQPLSLFHIHIHILNIDRLRGDELVGGEVPGMFETEGSFFVVVDVVFWCHYMLIVICPGLLPIIVWFCSLQETRACADYCLKCQMWLCEPCKRSHSKVPATKDHSISSLHDLHANGLEKLKQVGGLLVWLCSS